jgi:hypothetical protein
MSSDGSISCSGVKGPRGNTLPIAKGKARDDNAVEITSGIGGSIPHALNRRIKATSHSVRRVVYPVNVNDYSSGAFAAHLALGHLGRRPALKQREY